MIYWLHSDILSHSTVCWLNIEWERGLIAFFRYIYMERNVDPERKEQILLIQKSLSVCDLFKLFFHKKKYWISSCRIVSHVNKYLMRTFFSSKKNTHTQFFILIPFVIWEWEHGNTFMISEVSKKWVYWHV